MNNCRGVVCCVPKLFVKIREDLRISFCLLMNINLTLKTFVKIRDDLRMFFLSANEH